MSQDREARLAARLAALGVRETDLEEVFVRSAGPGGQNVNKTSTCVVLLHRPTGVSVRCQATRQQGMNRYLARQQLAMRLEVLRRERERAERARREKLRRQRRPRSGAAKERMLEGKARRARTKSWRRTVEWE